VFQVRDDLPHSVEGGGDAALPDSGAGQGGREYGEAVDRVDFGERHALTVATDQSAAPGLLAEVGITAAHLALQQLEETPTWQRVLNGSMA
jgi:hypothetical protein